MYMDRFTVIYCQRIYYRSQLYFRASVFTLDPLMSDRIET